MDGKYPEREEGTFSGKETADYCLRAILGGEYGLKEVDALVKVCHVLAVPYVRRRLNGDVVIKRTLELNISDFAFDCLADLFAFADSGEFPHFHAYFAAYPLDDLSKEEIFSHLRRLVFSQVNQGIFRLYNDVDPSLGKIIRNIKLALQQFQSLVIVERFGVQCLVPADGDMLLHKKSLEIEELESGLRGYLHGKENIPYMLGKLSLYLHENSESSRVVPLTSAAIVFRSIYTYSLEKTQYTSMDGANLESLDLEETIREAVRKTRERMSVQYLRKKNIRPSLLDTYFEVIEERMKRSFSGDGLEKGLRELLSERLRGMTTSEYRSKHRSRLEYLSRLAGEEVARRLKNR